MLQAESEFSKAFFHLGETPKMLVLPRQQNLSAPASIASARTVVYVASKCI